MKLFTMFIFLLLITACGGSSGDGNDVIEPDPVALNTKDVLADPDADFNTFQNVTFTVSNDSDLNVTLFIHDNLHELVARRYIESKGSTELTIQIPAADQSITVNWHYRELMQQRQFSLLNMGEISFTGFE